MTFDPVPVRCGSTGYSEAPACQRETAKSSMVQGAGCRVWDSGHGDRFEE